MCEYVLVCIYVLSKTCSQVYVMFGGYTVRYKDFVAIKAMVRMVRMKNRPLVILDIIKCVSKWIDPSQS